MDGTIRCSRYAFGPNRLHYCGPDANHELLEYIKDDFVDAGLERLLANFKTMYPYLKYIAGENRIKDPFDMRVVEAYWLGNSLLDNLNKRKFYSHLSQDHGLIKKLGKQSLYNIAKKIELIALPNHSFHVLNIWRRTGHIEEPHSLESIDKCRISWGKVIEIGGPNITVEVNPLIIEKEKLKLGNKLTKNIRRELESSFELDELKKGDTISIHWDVPCEILTENQLMRLKKYTDISIKLANTNTRKSDFHRGSRTST